ncbi:MAG TPA: serine/threonine-protein kinase [Methyloceanibacter sp.]|nr:serine/threonine-protein kinase [Methyloceanibacter sp.]
MHFRPPEPDAATIEHATVADGVPAQGPATLPSLDFLAPPEQPDELGRLGAYRVLEVLGIGGRGIVFLAEKMPSNERVALKVLLPHLAQNPAAKQRFLREARNTRSVEHHHCVQIFDVGEERGFPFLAMELLKGATLEDLIEGAGRLAIAEALRLGIQIADALAIAHARGLIHRDIKPANIWVDPAGGGRVKLLDFGLARSEHADVSITQPGAILGTPPYMSPEQARGSRVDHRADLYSFGCTLYRMVTGELPIKGDNLTGLLLAIADKEPAAPHQLNEAVPGALSDLIMKLLAKSPSRRPESALEVAGALRDIERDFARGNEPASTH